MNIRDLRNLDFEDIKSRLDNRRDIWVNVVLIALTLVASIYLWHAYRRDSLELERHIKDLTEKAGVVEKQASAWKTYHVLEKKFPQSISNDQMISQLSELAVKHNVQMTSLSPIQESSDDYLEFSHLEMSVAAANYQNLVDFTQSIEELPYAIRLKEWSGQMPQSVEAKIVMESLRLKNE